MAKNLSLLLIDGFFAFQRKAFSVLLTFQRKVNVSNHSGAGNLLFSFEYFLPCTGNRIHILAFMGLRTF
jgi:hypothetical protein